MLYEAMSVERLHSLVGLNQPLMQHFQTSHSISWIFPTAQINLSHNSRQNTFIHFLFIVVDCEALAETGT